MDRRRREGEEIGAGNEVETRRGEGRRSEGVVAEREDWL